MVAEVGADGPIAVEQHDGTTTSHRMTGGRVIDNPCVIESLLIKAIQPHMPLREMVRIPGKVKIPKLP